MGDYFPDENGSFVTVWENCEGDSFEAYLQRNGAVPEKEARGIILQIISLLRFAESRGYKLDGQDLMPGRLAFRSGEVKVTGAALLPSLKSMNADGRTGTRSSIGVSEVQHDSFETQETQDDAVW